MKRQMEVLLSLLLGLALAACASPQQHSSPALEPDSLQRAALAQDTDHDKEAITNLAKMFYYDKSIGQAPLRAEQLFEISAMLGQGEAQYLLGLKFRRAYGIAQDNQQAIKFIQMAVQEGNAEAQNTQAFNPATDSTDKTSH